jgi:hypothetical protein
MVKYTLVGGFAAVLAGAAMLAISSAPASAFTLASPSLEAPVAGGNVDRVWWDRWGRWHPGPRWGYGGGPGPWGYHHRNCWRGPYGHLHCRY